MSPVARATGLQPAPPLLDNPGLRGGSANSTVKLQLKADKGQQPYVFTVATASLAACGDPIAPPCYELDPATGLLTGHFADPASYSLTAQVTGADGLDSALETFEWRVSDWRKADLFVGVSFTGVSSPNDGIGRYRVLRPGASGATGLETVEIPTDDETWFWNTGLAFGCAVDPSSGLLYTTDFDAKVNVIDSLEGATGHEILQRIISARAPGASDPPTERRRGAVRGRSPSPTMVSPSRRRRPGP